MRDVGYRGTGSVVPDLAFALLLAEPEAHSTGVPPRIAINVYPYRDPQYDPTETDGGAGFAEYVATFAELVAAASARGFRPVLFGSQRADARVLDLIQEQLSALAPELGEVERHMPETLAGLMAVIDGSDFVVATRYHAILLAVLRGRPTIGICYQSKSRRLLEMAGLGEYAIEAEGLTTGAVLDQVTNTAATAGASARTYARAMAMRTECISGFDEALERCLPGLVVGNDARLRLSH